MCPAGRHKSIGIAFGMYLYGEIRNGIKKIKAIVIEGVIVINNAG